MRRYLHLLAKTTARERCLKAFRRVQSLKVKRRVFDVWQASAEKTEEAIGVEIVLKQRLPAQ